MFFYLLGLVLQKRCLVRSSTFDETTWFKLGLEFLDKWLREVKKIDPFGTKGLGMT